MKPIFTILFLAMVFSSAFAQDFINGDFEINTATGDVINPSAIVFNDLMSNCNSYGTQPNIDILSTSGAYGNSQNGDWFVALTGGQSDRLNIELTAPLVSGNSYSISFSDRTHSGFVPDTIKIGLSMSNNDIGDLIYTVPELSVDTGWIARSFSFVAPNDGMFISVYTANGNTSNWTLIDNFSFVTTNSTLSLLNNDDLKLIQNPVSDYVKLKTNVQLMDAMVLIISTTGNLVFSKEYDIVDRLDIDVSKLPNGFYIVHVQTKDLRYKNLKFIKQ